MENWTVETLKAKIAFFREKSKIIVAENEYCDRVKWEIDEIPYTVLKDFAATKKYDLSNHNDRFLMCDTDYDFIDIVLWSNAVKIKTIYEVEEITN